jgi:hypothetical protein
MKLFCISILLGILQFSGLQAQGTALLRDFDFAQPGYSILLLPIDRLGRWSDTMQVKYYDHSQALETFKRELTGFEPARIYRFACFDDYAMVVAKGGKQEARLTVSQNCHSISSPQGEFTFWGYNFVEGQKISKCRTHQFQDVAEARATLANLQGQPGLLYIPDPQWREYEGVFTFVMNKVLISNEEQRKRLEAELSKVASGEKFEMESHLGSGNSTDGFDFTAEVRCSRVLFDRIKLGISKHLTFRPFPLTLVSIWKN